MRRNLEKRKSRKICVEKLSLENVIFEFEDEIKVMLKPLSDLLEKKKRNKVFKLKPAKQMTKCNEYDFNIKP